MTDSPSIKPLPDLQQAEFDAAELETLLRDIEACARVTEVIPKYGPHLLVPDNPVLTVEAGKQLLIAGVARAVQFRYEYQGVQWWDTVMALPGGRFRLVRIQHQFDSPGA